MRTAYKARAYPTPEQAAILNRTVGVDLGLKDFAVLSTGEKIAHPRSLAKAISGSGWGTFRTLLAYKAAQHGRHLIVIDRWYPSSKTCSACGHVLAELSLGTRRWTCPGCGALHDRDINAAKNILAAGLAVTACGGDVRHSGSSRVRSPTKQGNSSPRGPQSPSNRAESSQWLSLVSRHRS